MKGATLKMERNCPSNMMCLADKNKIWFLLGYSMWELDVVRSTFSEVKISFGQDILCYDTHTVLIAFNTLLVWFVPYNGQFMRVHFYDLVKKTWSERRVNLPVIE